MFKLSEDADHIQHARLFLEDDYIGAAACLFKTLKKSRSSGDRMISGHVLCRIAYMYELTSNYEKARQHYLEAKEEYQISLITRLKYINFLKDSAHDLPSAIAECNETLLLAQQEFFPRDEVKIFDINYLSKIRDIRAELEKG